MTDIPREADLFLMNLTQADSLLLALAYPHVKNLRLLFASMTKEERNEAIGLLFRIKVNAGSFHSVFSRLRESEKETV